MNYLVGEPIQFIPRGAAGLGIERCRCYQNFHKSYPVRILKQAIYLNSTYVIRHLAALSILDFLSPMGCHFFSPPDAETPGLRWFCNHARRRPGNRKKWPAAGPRCGFALRAQSVFRIKSQAKGRIAEGHDYYLPEGVKNLLTIRNSKCRAKLNK